MRSRQIAIAAATLALSLQAIDALAVECYEIIDKDQNSTFRASHPPFAMAGDEWTKQQDQLRANSLHLRWYFTTDCSPRLLASGEKATRKQPDVVVFDPEVVLRSTPEYMTASGRPSSAGSPPR